MSNFDKCRKWRDETSNRYHNRIHVSTLTEWAGGGLVVSYSYKPDGYNKVCVWLVPGTFRQDTPTSSNR